MTQEEPHKAAWALSAGASRVPREQSPGFSDQWTRYGLGKGRRQGCVSTGGAQSWGEDSPVPGGKRKKQKVCQHANERNLILLLSLIIGRILNFIKHVGQDTYFEVNFDFIFNTFL